jgi:hypothetical protein
MEKVKNYDLNSMHTRELTSDWGWTDDILPRYRHGKPTTLAINPPNILSAHTRNNNRLSLHNYTMLDVLPFSIHNLPNLLLGEDLFLIFFPTLFSDIFLQLQHLLETRYIHTQSGWGGAVN